MKDFVTSRLRWAHAGYAILAIIAIIAGTIYLNRGPVNPSAAAVKTATPNLHLSIGGWLPYWDNGSGLDTFHNDSSLFTEIHTFEYQATSATQIELEGHESHHTTVANAVKKTKAANVPTLTESMNTADFTALLNDPAARAQHAQAVCDWTVNNGYDGVDIDYEEFVVALSSAQAPVIAPLYTALMQSMADCLHKHKKTLEITVMARTGDPRFAYYESHLSVSAYDYAALGKVADYIQPMAYDYSYPGSAPGSVDPIEWFKAVVNFTTARVDPKKVQVGIALYGYDWLTKGSAITASAATKLAASNKVVPTRDAASQSLVFTYTLNGNNHTVWYDDTQALAMRVAVARQAGLNGVSFWALGDEQAGSFADIVRLPTS